MSSVTVIMQDGTHRTIKDARFVDIMGENALYVRDEQDYTVAGFSNGVWAYWVISVEEDPRTEVEPTVEVPTTPGSVVRHDGRTWLRREEANNPTSDYFWVDARGNVEYDGGMAYDAVVLFDAGKQES